MPTIFFKFGLRYYFVSYDCREPLHIHVGDDMGKYASSGLKEVRHFLRIMPDLEKMS